MSSAEMPEEKSANLKTDQQKSSNLKKSRRLKIKKGTEPQDQWNNKMSTLCAM